MSELRHGGWLAHFIIGGHVAAFSPDTHGMFSKDICIYVGYDTEVSNILLLYMFRLVIG